MKSLFEKTKFQSKFTDISQNIYTNWQEKSFAFGREVTTTNEAVTPVKIGDNLSGLVGISAMYPNMILWGAIHTHPKKDGAYKSYSFKDIFSFSQANTVNPQFHYFLVVAYDGTVYALTITDQTAFTEFFKSHSESYYVNTENTNEISTDIGGDIRNVIQDFQRKGKTKDEGYEAGLAFVMKKYNMGMAISKRENNGNFKPIFVNELPDPMKPKKKTYEETNDCNL